MHTAGCGLETMEEISASGTSVNFSNISRGQREGETERENERKRERSFPCGL